MKYWSTCLEIWFNELFIWSVLFKMIYFCLGFFPYIWDLKFFVYSVIVDKFYHFSTFYNFRDEPSSWVWFHCRCAFSLFIVLANAKEILRFVCSLILVFIVHTIIFTQNNITPCNIWFLHLWLVIFYLSLVYPYFGRLCCRLYKFGMILIVAA